MNKRTIIAECSPRSPNPIDAHMRNSIIISEELNCDLVTTRDDIKRIWHKQYDNIVYAYGSFYVDHKALLKLMLHNKKAELWWLTNEYQVGLNTFMNHEAQDRGGFSIIANFPERACVTKNAKKYYQINLNLLFARDCNRLTDKKYNCIYYGSWRPDRIKDFRKYFDERMTVSSSKKNIKKFINAGCKATYINKLNWQKHKETLNRFKFSLYIEDESTHSNYNYLANRFYEALFCNVITLFDVKCANTIEQQQFKIEDVFVVAGKDDLWDRIQFISTDYAKYLSLQHIWVKQVLQEREKMIIEMQSMLQGGNNG